MGVFFPILSTECSQNILLVLTETFTCSFTFWLPDSGKAGRCQSAGQWGGIKPQQPPSLLVVKELGGSDHFLDRVEKTLFHAVDVS